MSAGIVTEVTATRLDSIDEALAAARAAATALAVSDADRDRERRLPHAEIDDLSAAGLLAITVPKRFGGVDVPPSVLTEVVRLIATADPNVAQIPHSHFVYLNLLRLGGSEELRRAQFTQVLGGGRIANAQSERGGKTIADISTTLSTRAGGGHAGELRLDGEKFYATGSLFAHTLAVLARLDEPAAGLAPGEYVAFLPADSPGVTLVDDWNGLGQRTTGSGTVRFDDAPVDPANLIARAGVVSAPTGYGAYAQLLHVAIDAGIARGALDAAVDFVRTKTRPWFEAGVERAVDDPLLIQRFGELGVEVATAEATLAAAARAVDATWTVDDGVADTRHDVDPEVLAEASIAVATAKVVADRAANEVASAVFEVSGTRSADASLNLDRFWRNARTHTLHDPGRWKYQHIGRYVLRGDTPPLHGVI